MKTRIQYLIYASLISILSVSCTPLGDISQASVAGRKVEYVSEGTGSPTLVFETGMGQTITTWLPIFDTLSTITSAYAYNRPGYANSNIVNPPMTTAEVAIQLHQNLAAADLRPPYILVGHSAGGLYINMFARLYPSEIAGVIFLDSSHPDQFEYFKTDHAMLYQMLITATTNGDKKYELSLVKNTQSDFLNAPAFPDVPVSVLTAGKKSSALESDKLRTKWLKFQNDLASLSDKSTHIIAERSGHYIHKDRPDLVISEIMRIGKFNSN